MVIVTRSTYRKAYESFESSENSQENIVPPPWCSLAKVPGRKSRVASERERRSVSPLRENICEYLHGARDRDKRKYKRKHRACCTQTQTPGNKGRGKILISLAFLFAGVMILYIYTSNLTMDMDTSELFTKVVPTSNLLSLLGLEQTSVEYECCSRMKYLIADLLRAEYALRSSQRLRKTMMLAAKTSAKIDPTRSYIEGIIVTRDRDTQVWGSRVALWGLVPLWRAAPPPDTVLALRRPVPSDCWPFSASAGKLWLELPRAMRVSGLSVEHVYPDAASSAPRHFALYGILANGTWLKTVYGEYRRGGGARQYYPLRHPRSLYTRLVFQVFSNHGNPHYTCLYRVHLYENKDVDVL